VGSSSSAHRLAAVTVAGLGLYLAVSVLLFRLRTDYSLLHDVESDVRGRDVVLVDDILESGRTLAYAKDLFAARRARRVLTCVLLEKPGKRAVELDADFVGFHCPDLFVVGYGMDVAHKYRQLPFVGVVEKSI